MTSTNNTYPLWQLLLLTKNKERSLNLTCEECFALLEYDAELLAAGVKLEELQNMVRHHLNLCSGCQTELQDRIDQLADLKL
jgi:hypothetical protein